MTVLRASRFDLNDLGVWANPDARALRATAILDCRASNTAHRSFPFVERTMQLLVDDEVITMSPLAYLKPRLFLGVYTATTFACVAIFVAALFAYLAYPPNRGESASTLHQLVLGYFVYLMYVGVAAGKSALIAGAVEGAWFSLRIGKIKWITALLIEAVGVVTVFVVALGLIYRILGCRPGEFGCGAEFWWFTWLVLASTSVLCACGFSSRVLIRPGPSVAD